MTGVAWFGYPYFADYPSIVEPAPEPTVEGYLGCGQYEALLLTRGGGAIVAEIPWSQLQWARVLDDTSQASLRADGDVEPPCSPELAGMRPWRHELAIYRDGSQVWVGPVVTPEGQGQPLQDNQWLLVAARDLSAWWDHRRIHIDHDYSLSATDIASIFQDLSDDAMAPDPSPGLSISTTPTGIMSTAQFLAAQNLIAGTQIRNLSDAGFDWTVVVRQVLAGGTTVVAGDLGLLTDDHFVVPPHVVYDGTAQANSWVVAGAGTGAAGDAIAAEADDPAAEALDGLLESVTSNSTLQDYNSVLAAAQSNLELTQTALSVQDAYLAPNAPVTIAQLIPGALCTLALAETIFPVLGRFRLQSVTGTARASDGIEQIACVFQPVGSV